MENINKPGAAKAAGVIVLISTICGIGLSLISFIALLGTSIDFGSWLNDLEHTLALTFTAGIWGVGFLINVAGLFGGIKLQKNQRLGPGLSRMWAIVMIVLSLASAVPGYILVMRSDMHSTSNFNEIWTSFYLMNLNTMWQWVLGVITIVLLGRPQVKAFYTTSDKLVATDDVIQQATGSITEKAENISDQGTTNDQRQLINNSDGILEVGKRPGIIKAAAIVMLICTTIGFLLTGLAAAQAIHLKALTTLDSLLSALFDIVGAVTGMVFNAIGFAGAIALLKTKRSGLALGRTWAIGVIVILVFTIAIPILYVFLVNLPGHPLQTQIASGLDSSAARVDDGMQLATMFLMLNSTFLIAPAILVLSFLSRKQVKEYMKSHVAPPVP